MQSQDLDRIRFVTRHFHDLQGLRYWVPLGLMTLGAGGAAWFEKRPWTLSRAGLILGVFLLALGLALGLVLGARRYYRRTFGEVELQPIQPVADLSSVSIFSPAGSLAPPTGVRQLTTAVRNFRIILGLALAVVFVLKAITIPTGIYVDEHEPWRLGMDSLSDGGYTSFARPFLGQMALALHGSFFLSVWLWRGRRLSQSYHLILGTALVGLSVYGACVGSLFGLMREVDWRFLIHVIFRLDGVVMYPSVALLLCGSSMILAGLLDHWQLVRALRPRVED